MVAEPRVRSMILQEVSSFSSMYIYTETPLTMKSWILD